VFNGKYMTNFSKYELKITFIVVLAMLKWTHTSVIHYGYQGVSLNRTPVSHGYFFRPGAFWLNKQKPGLTINLTPDQLIASDGVLEDRPWPQGSSRTTNHVLGLESPGLGLEGSGLVLGLDGPGLGYMHVIVILWNVWCKCILPSSPKGCFSF